VLDGGERPAVATEKKKFLKGRRKMEKEQKMTMLTKRVGGEWAPEF